MLDERMKEITEHEKHIRELMKRNSKIVSAGGCIEYNSVELNIKQSNKIEESKYSMKNGKS